MDIGKKKADMQKLKRVLNKRDPVDRQIFKLVKKGHLKIDFVPLVG